ncbi:hypothetical protein Bpfe_022463 [Biomphalaria pfeifferi]|uniref:Uncharacterized protein n=1 Tax=Biomphalaria pfeifferi TaxID=112525 RepID=A0AAD8B6A5_BIOPF|nr:hypothetical protein Bpfe_022463 [Biomphalaria pfeifferi]
MMTVRQTLNAKFSIKVFLGTRDISESLARGPSRDASLKSRSGMTHVTTCCPYLLSPATVSGEGPDLISSPHYFHLSEQ